MERTYRDEGATISCSAHAQMIQRRPHSRRRKDTPFDEARGASMHRYWEFAVRPFR